MVIIVQLLIPIMICMSVCDSKLQRQMLIQIAEANSNTCFRSGVLNYFFYLKGHQTSRGSGLGPSSVSVPNKLWELRKFRYNAFKKTTAHGIWQVSISASNHREIGQTCNWLVELIETCQVLLENVLKQLSLRHVTKQPQSKALYNVKYRGFF